jgi:hypothetical protein
MDDNMIPTTRRGAPQRFRRLRLAALHRLVSKIYRDRLVSAAIAASLPLLILAPPRGY